MPRRRTRPVVGTSTRDTTFSRVLFPAPLRPTMPKISPRFDLEVDPVQREEVRELNPALEEPDGIFFERPNALLRGAVAHRDIFKTYDGVSRRLRLDHAL